MRGLKLTFFIFGILLIMITSGELLVNPTPFMDEGYYLGATHAVLKGDFFLRHYAFDKPFLVAFWPIAGILILGENPLGFKLVSLILYLSSFVLFTGLLQKVAKGWIRNYFLSLALFLLPLMQRYGVSNYCEPYLIFSLIVMVRALADESADLNRTTKVRIMNGFFMGALTKYSMVLWSPMIAMSWFVRTPFSWRGFGTKLFDFLKSGRYWIGAAFLFSLTNATKFASISWFSTFSTDVQAKSTLIERIGVWTRMLWNSFEVPVFSALAIVLFLFGFAIAIQKKQRRNLLLFWCPVVIHLGLIIFSGARFYDRYLVIVLPVFFICLSLALKELEIRTQKVSLAWSLLPMVGAGYGFTQPKTHIGGDPELGRLIYVAKREVDRSSGFLFNQFGWNTAAFFEKTVQFGLTSKEWVAEEGLAVQRLNQFALVNDDQNHPQLLRAPLRAQSLMKSNELTVDFSIADLPQRVLTQLRLGKSFDVVESSWSPGSSVQVSDFPGWEKLFNGQRFRLKLQSKRVYPFQNGKTTFELIGALGINPIHDLEQAFNQPRYTLLLLVESVWVNGVDRTDSVMPLFFDGYTLRLGVLPTDFRADQILDQPQVDGQHLKVRSTVSSK